MTDPASLPAEPSPRWRMTDLVLAELLVVVVLWALAVAVWGARALPWTTSAEAAGNAQRAVTDAAQRGVLAFLDIDYRDIDNRTKAVIDLSTGPFREQYAYGSTDLRVEAMRARSVSVGTIRSAAVNGVSGSHAKVLVGADTVLKTSGTKTSKATRDCPHRGATCNRYRFLVSLTRVDGRWLMSDLAEVP